jgi:hypothetical protein
MPPIADPTQLVNRSNGSLLPQALLQDFAIFVRIISTASSLEHATARHKHRTINISAHFFLTQMMPLCQLRNTRVRCYTFNCQLDALEHPPLPFVRLHDLAADFLKDLFRFDIQGHPTRSMQRAQCRKSI